LKCTNVSSRSRTSIKSLDGGADSVNGVLFLGEGASIGFGISAGFFVAELADSLPVLLES